MGLFGGKKNKGSSESHFPELEEWLAHPNEFGVAPKKTWLIGTFNKIIYPNPKPIDIKLVGYEMPDGTKGRAFLGYITWSFMGDDVNAISDESIVLAYTGWAFLFPGLQDGSFATDFDESEQEKKFRTDMSKLKGFEITSKVRIGELELFEYVGLASSGRIRGCGSIESNLYYTEDMPEFNLPTIYHLLGHEQNG